MGLYFSDNEIRCTECGNKRFKKETSVMLEQRVDGVLEQDIKNYYICKKCGKELYIK